MTHILFAGKFPPVQGGTSAQALWLAHWLVDAGATVSAIDASYAYDPWQCSATSDEDWAGLFERFPTLRGVERRVLASDLEEAGVYPPVEPLVTRLVDACLGEIERCRPSAVYVNYLDPYAFAAWIACRTAGVPLVYRHAGSDLARQAPAVGRRRAYQNVFADSGLILTSVHHAPAVLRAGARRDRLRTHTPRLTPPGVHAPSGPVLPRRGAAIRLGMVGKVGSQRGVLESVEAVRRLRERGVDVELTFLTGVGGPSVERLERALLDSGQDPADALIPYLPPWRVGEYLRSCDALLCLEHNFHIAHHHPSMPSEFAASGRAMVLSGDVRRFQRFAGDADGGVVVVEDPSDVGSLTSAIAGLVHRADELPALGASNLTLCASDGTETARGWTRALLGEIDDL